MQNSRPSALPCKLSSGSVESAVVFPAATQRAPGLASHPCTRLAWRTPGGAPVDAYRGLRKALDISGNVSDANTPLWPRTSARARRHLLAAGSAFEKQAQCQARWFPSSVMRNASLGTAGSPLERMHIVARAFCLQRNRVDTCVGILFRFELFFHCS